MSTQMNLSVSRDKVEKEKEEEDNNNKEEEEKVEEEKYVNSDESFCASRDKVASTIERSRENI